jgi:hypothetical protein
MVAKRKAVNKSTGETKRKRRQRGTLRSIEAQKLKKKIIANPLVGYASVIPKSRFYKYLNDSDTLNNYNVQYTMKHIPFIIVELMKSVNKTLEIVSRTVSNSGRKTITGDDISAHILSKNIRSCSNRDVGNRKKDKNDKWITIKKNDTCPIIREATALRYILAITEFDRVSKSAASALNSLLIERIDKMNKEIGLRKAFNPKSGKRASLDEIHFDI